MGQIFERKEIKYLLTKQQYQSLMKSIKSHVLPDIHPQYCITNLYFDTPDHRLIRRSLEKPLYKEKMRLRSYGPIKGTDPAYWELKKKFKGIVYKRRICQPLNTILDVYENRQEWTDQVGLEIAHFSQIYPNLKPVMHISYERMAYCGLLDSSLRITFDQNILWREEALSLTSPLGGCPLLHEEEILMEIKCFGSMPLWITKTLSEHQIFPSSFSKYGRAYGEKILLQNAA
ncbi:MAG: polyphosphate polymerase domain-containing protein [Spirochaetales bacterium]|nr:polyphosphate polymerase domain-containing protein [Spirochaetales bacterium]